MVKLTRDHWMLFVICPRECTAYILDSNRGLKSLKDYTVIKHVERAVATFNKKSNKSRSSRMTWIFPKCNQQCSNWECGYYVLNWMEDFVMFRQYGFPQNIWNETEPFSDKSWMNALRHGWKPLWISI